MKAHALNEVDSQRDRAEERWEPGGGKEGRLDVIAGLRPGGEVVGRTGWRHWW
jgi:hypothetical protein